MCGPYMYKCESCYFRKETRKFIFSSFSLLFFCVCVCVVVSICTHNAISFEYQWNMKGERKDADINPMVLKKRLETLYNNFIRFGIV